ncbi:Immunoglobulin superfamily member 11 [Varanus komodoensis]|nr:Immunoglobulin superfamily member 11 [Varanus komodoensis]
MRRGAFVSAGAESVQVVQGGSALLPCSFHTAAPLGRLNIIWTVAPAAEPGRPQQVLAYEQGEVVESVSRYAGRAAFAFPPTTSASLALSDARGADSGAYQCSVTNPPDTATPSIAVVRLTVFVPPSPPRCSSEGDREEGGDFQLSCAVEEGFPVPTLTWEKTPPDAQPLVMSYEGDRRALLTLRNLTAAASGLYRCSAANMLGSASCAQELRVRGAPAPTSPLAVGIALVLAMGLVLLTLVALALWLHHRSADQRTDEDLAPDKRTDGFSPGRLIIAQGPPGDGSAAHPATKPLWVFTSSTPNTTYAHREWRPQPGHVGQATLPARPGQALQGRWRSGSLSQLQGSSSSSEEKHPGPSPFPKQKGFLV